MGRQEGARQNQGQGAGRGPRGKEGNGDTGSRGQAGRSTGTGGEGQGTGQGKGGGAPPQPDVQVLSIPPGIRLMPAHHAHRRHQLIYNMDPDMGGLILPQPPQPPHQPAPRPRGDIPHGPVPAAREPRAEPARMAAAPAARRSGAAPAQQAQEPRVELARGAEGTRNDWARDVDAIPDPLGGEALPLVMEVYWWLSWATSRITRGLRNRSFDALLLRRDRGDQEVPRGAGWPRRTTEMSYRL